MDAPVKTALVVDDDRQILWSLEKRLSQIGLVVLTAANGGDALELAKAGKMDVILLDVRLPGKLDGLGLAVALRDDPGHAHVPIIFVTGMADGHFKAHCQEVGGNYFVCKPYDPDLLVRLIQSVLAQDELAEIRRISAAKRRQPMR